MNIQITQRCCLICIGYINSRECEDGQMAYSKVVYRNLSETIWRYYFKKFPRGTEEKKGIARPDCFLNAGEFTCVVEGSSSSYSSLAAETAFSTTTFPVNVDIVSENIRLQYSYYIHDRTITICSYFTRA
jgi:hypothetical protein